MVSLSAMSDLTILARFAWKGTHQIHEPMRNPTLNADTMDIWIQANDILNIAIFL